MRNVKLPVWCATRWIRCNEPDLEYETPWVRLAATKKDAINLCILDAVYCTEGQGECDADEMESKLSSGDVATAKLNGGMTMYFTVSQISSVYEGDK